MYARREAGVMKEDGVMNEGYVLNQVLFELCDGMSLPIYLIMSVTGVVFFHLLVEIRYKNREKKPRLSWAIPYDLLILYVCFIVQITLINREPGSRGEINLKILNIFEERLRGDQICFNLLNIVMFVPFGYLFGWTRRNNSFFSMLLLAAGVSYLGSFLIEITQLITKSGYFETMDLITNLLGGCVGAIVGWLVMRPENKELKERDNG